MNNPTVALAELAEKGPRRGHAAPDGAVHGPAHHGHGCRVTFKLPSASSADHSFLGRVTHMPRVTFGKSRVRESCMLGSVRAKPNGLATGPRSENSVHGHAEIPSTMG